MDSFDVLVRVNNMYFITSSVYSPINVTLALYSGTNGTLISTIFTKTLTDTVTFSNLNIISQDLYYYQASCSNCATTKTNILNITTYVKSIVLVPQTTSTSVNFDIPLDVSLIAYDGTPFTGLCSFSLTESSKSLKGNSFSIIQGSSTNLSIWFNETGSKNLTASCANLTVENSSLPEISKTIALTIYPLVLGNDSFISHSNTSSLFNLTIGVYNYSGNVIENTKGPYSISLSLLPNETITGTTTLSTLNGYANFTNLSIQTIGNYQINATSNSSLIKGSTIPFKTFFVLSSLSISVTSNPRLNMIFQIPVNLISNYKTTYNVSSTLSISCENLTVFTNPISTSNGSATFTGYFNKTGQITCTVTELTNSISQNITLIINPTTNTDPICLVSSSANVCYLCNSNSTNIKGLCTCKSNSYYNSTIKDCACSPGYSLANNFCTQCGNFFSSSEITSYFSLDYKKIIVNFARPVYESNNENCDSIITLPPQYSSYTYSCYWTMRTNMTINFGQLIRPSTGIIIFDPTKIHAVGEICNFQISSLSPNITQIYPVPVPSSTINSPSVISLSCNLTNLFISTSSISPDYEYSWFWSTSVKNKDLRKKNFQSKQSNIEVSPYNFNAGITNISLKVSSMTFGTSASAITQILVNNDSVFSVTFPIGSQLSILSTDSILLEPTLLGTCGYNGLFSYVWTYSVSSNSAPPLNLAKFVNDYGPYKLYIPPANLYAGYNYTFTVTVSTILDPGSSAITGSASIQVSCLPSTLVITISKTSGVISKSSDLIITAKASDPDNPSSNFSIK